jgi:hypothetical protein
MIRSVIAKKTSVSLTVEATMPTEENDLASLLTHSLVGPMCVPLMENRTTMFESVEAQIRAKNPTMRRFVKKTARIRKKNKREFEGIATATHHPIAVCRAEQSSTEPTAEAYELR